jgi:hypothetical protein
MDYATDAFGEHTYRFRKMNAFDQLHVMRRLAPLISKLGKLSDLTMDSAFGPIASAMSEMPDSDVNYILEKCLAVVDRRLPDGSWMRVWNKDARQMQFEDLQLSDMLQLTGRAISENVGGFLGGSPALSSAPLK